MSRLAEAISLTMAIWVFGTTAYALYSVSSILAQPNLAVYERNGLLPALGFAVYRLPYLLIALVVVIVLELIFIQGEDRVPNTMI